jgi:thiol-disulfide isomerase/thioredoxin
MRKPLLPLLLLLTLLAAGCASASSQESGVGDFVSRSGVSTYPVDEREAAPAVSGETLDGDELALDDYAGMPVLVNFWASWCGPCAREAPHLRTIADEYAGRVAMLGVNVKDQPANARSFERDFRITYPSLYDEAAVIASQFGGVGPAALPTTMLLDGEHRVAVRMFGAVSAAELSPHLDALLDELDEA